MDVSQLTLTEMKLRKSCVIKSDGVQKRVTTSLGFVMTQKLCLKYVTSLYTQLILKIDESKQN